MWWHCGYPPGDAACAKGWDRLKSEVGIEPHTLLQATASNLASLLKAGGLVPEVRAQRLKKIAMRVRDEMGGDLTAALRGPVSQARKVLKTASCCLPGSRLSRRFRPIAHKS